MKALRFLAQVIFLSSAVVCAEAQATNTNSTTVIGQWDFETSNLAAATVGSPLQFIGFQPGFVSLPISGRLAGAMSFPATTDAQRILATFAPTNNGGGTNLNQYTIIMDLMWPRESEGTWRAIFNSDMNNTSDAEIFLDPDGSIGVGGFNAYAGTLQPELWYRMALVVDLETNQIYRYLNGANVLGTNGPSGFTLLGESVDGRFSLNDGILFFADNDGETAPGYVSVIQLRAGAMTAEEVAALGGPASNGLGEGGAPVGDVKIESIRREGNQVIITVNNAGRSVQLQTTSNIAAPQSWTNVGNPSTSPTFSATIGNNPAFFRVQVL